VSRVEGIRSGWLAGLVGVVRVAIGIATSSTRHCYLTIAQDPGHKAAGGLFPPRGEQEASQGGVRLGGLLDSTAADARSANPQAFYRATHLSPDAL